MTRRDAQRMLLLLQPFGREVGDVGVGVVEERGGERGVVLVGLLVGLVVVADDEMRVLEVGADVLGDMEAVELGLGEGEEGETDVAVDTEEGKGAVRGVACDCAELVPVVIPTKDSPRQRRFWHG